MQRQVIRKEEALEMKTESVQFSSVLFQLCVV